MDRLSRVAALNGAVASQIEQLKNLSPDQLLSLGQTEPHSEVVVGGKTYELYVSSEPICHEVEGLCVVISRLIERRLIGSNHYVQGFVVQSDGSTSPMTERELWQYD